MQAHHVNDLYSVVDAAVQQLEPSNIESSLAAAEALRGVLEAQQTLQANPTEAALKQLLAVLKQAGEQLRQACWLLVTQHQTAKDEVNITLFTLLMVANWDLERLCMNVFMAASHSQDEIGDTR